MSKDTPAQMPKDGGSVSNAIGLEIQSYDTGPVPEVNDSIGFLRMFRPEGPWVLIAIVPDGRITTRTFRPEQKAHLREWLDVRGGHENIYFQVNDTGDKSINKKPTKADIVAAHWLHVDIDPNGDPGLFDAERKRLLKKLKGFSPPPSLVIDSGNGYQGFWRLSEPVRVANPSEEAWADFERYNRQIEADLGADHCFNVDRIMRLPGTINVPNKKKRSKGRVPRKAQTICFDQSQHQLSEFRKAPELKTCPTDRVTVTSAEPVDWDALPASVKSAALHNCNSLGEVYTDRSDGVFHVCCEALRKRVQPGQVLSLILDKDMAVSEHIYDQKNPEDYARRQVERAMQVVDGSAAGPEWDRVSKDGTPLPSFGNAQEALRALDVQIWHDAFCDRDMVHGHAIQDFSGIATDKALLMLRDMVRRKWGFDPGKEHLRDAFGLVALENQRDPVVDYLDSLSWDGEQRLCSWLTKACGASDTPYVQAVGELMLRAMCARAREPGVKFDHMVILEGPQGAGKSMSLKILAGDWFSDAGLFSASNDRDRGELLQGNWINEVAELDGLSKRDVTEVKRFITQRHDEYRAAYAHKKEQRPRRGILVGTTNDNEWNRDPTGARRFLPIRCAEFDLDWLRANRDQLLAEADMEHRKPLFLPEAVWASATEEQAKRRATHAWDAYLEEMIPEQRNGGTERVSTVYVMEKVLGLNPGTIAQQNTAKLLGERMRGLGWEGPMTLAFRCGRRAKGYRRPSNEPDLFAPPEPPF